MKRLVLFSVLIFIITLIKFICSIAQIFSSLAWDTLYVQGLREYHATNETEHDSAAGP